MSAGVVFSQMLIIFSLMLAGMFFRKSGLVSEHAAKDISVMVVNLCNPMQLIMSVFETEPDASAKASVAWFFLMSMAVFLILALFGRFLCAILRIPAKLRGDYQLMAVFCNCGFIGIPVTRALLGTDALIYVAVFNLCWSIYFYTYGIWIIRQDMDPLPAGKKPHALSQAKMFVNPGNLACIATILIFWFQIQVPPQLQNLCSYTGGAATFLALFVIGISLCDLTWEELFKDSRLFVFAALRFALFPVLFTICSKGFFSDPMMQKTAALMTAMPVGNLPAMVRAQFGQDNRLTAKGAVITTMLSVVTITLTCVFI